MVTLPREILDRASLTLRRNGFETANLIGKIEQLCRIFQLFLAIGYEGLWVSVCSRENDVILNMAILHDQSDIPAFEDNLAAAFRSIDADLQIVICETSWIQSEAINSSGSEASEHSVYPEGLAVIVQEGSQRFLAFKFLERIENDFVFSDLIVMTAPLRNGLSAVA